MNDTQQRAMNSLNVLCVRLVFCMYAEDAGIFGHHGMFHDYLKEFDARPLFSRMRSRTDSCAPRNKHYGAGKYRCHRRIA